MMLPLQAVQTKAETVSNLEDFKEFDSFQKRYYEHLTDLSYYIGSSYESNQHYFKENMQAYREAVNSVYDSSFINSLFDSSEKLFTKPVALLSTLPDLRKKIFDSVKSFFGKEELIERDYETNKAWNQFILAPPTGYHFDYYNYNGNIELKGQRSLQLKLSTGSGTIDLYMENSIVSGTSQQRFQGYAYDVWGETWSKVSDGSMSSGDFWKFYTATTGFYGVITLVKDNQEVPIMNNTLPPQLQNVYNNVVNNYNDGQRFDENYTPSAMPYLVCGNGNIDLNYTDGVFYTKEQTRSLNVVLVSPDGKANYSGQECLIDFKFPELEFDELTGDITADGQSLVRIPSLPSEPPEDYDYTLLGYIRNSYEYATTFITTGVEGLRSIVVGTTGLLSLVGSVFSFLPTELLTLIIGGFGIALGLWVIKK